jgi:hypothetical protein
MQFYPEVDSQTSLYDLADAECYQYGIHLSIHDIFFCKRIH